MKFYLPNFEDLVDPEYDFINDVYSPKREKAGRYNHDWYAHQFFDEPIFDGMLVSKTVVTASAEKRIRESGSMHTYCRLDTNIPIMGDCGAFTYFEEDVPPYSISEILAYYSELGFSSGVSIDHVIFASMPMDERERRMEITLQNAKTFLTQHQAEGHQFTPIGIAQGWDPRSRRQAVERLLNMGYKHFALWFSPDDGNELYDIVNAAVAEHAVISVSLPESWTQLRFADEQRCTTLVRQAGFGRPGFKRLPIVWTFDEPEDVLVNIDKVSVRGKMIIDGQPAAVQRRIKETILARTEAQRTNGVMTMNWPALLVTAQKPQQVRGDQYAA